MELNEKVVLLSISNEWAEAILTGRKTYEYRRQPPAIEPPYKVVLYATADMSAIVGQFTTFEVLKGPIDDLVNRTINHTPHSEDDIQSYFEGKKTGSAIRVAGYQRYSSRLSLDEVQSVDDEFRPPQNFRYLRPSEDERILELVSNRGTPHAQQPH